MRLVSFGESNRMVGFLEGNLDPSEGTSGFIAIPPHLRHDFEDLIRGEKSLIEETMMEYAKNGKNFNRVKLYEVQELGRKGGINLNPSIANNSVKIICVGGNYPSHVANIRNESVKETEKNLEDAGISGFFKISTSVVGPYSDIIKPKRSDYFDYEVELAAVIGRTGKDINRKEALDHVLGFTVLIDYSLRDLQEPKGVFNLPLKKNFDTCASIGPGLLLKSNDFDPMNLKLLLTVNGELRQSGNTSEMIHKLDELIEWYSRDFTLLPGDIISTGTCSGTALEHEKRHDDRSWYLKPGDLVDAFVENIGHVRNRII